MPYGLNNVIGYDNTTLALREVNMLLLLRTAAFSQIKCYEYSYQLRLLK